MARNRNNNGDGETPDLLSNEPTAIAIPPFSKPSNEPEYLRLKNGFLALEFGNTIAIFDKDKKFLFANQNHKIQTILDKEKKPTGFVNVVAIFATESKHQTDSILE